MAPRGEQLSLLPTEGDRHAMVPQDEIETVYIEPYGFPHKRIGDAAFPPFIEATNILNLPRNLRLQKDDVLISIPAGLMGDIQVMELLINLCEHQLPVERDDPLRPCAFKDQLIERNGSGVSSSKSNCYFTLLPPWLLPEEWWSSDDHGKIVVMTSDPRYLLMRQPHFWRFVSAQCLVEAAPASMCDGACYIQSYLESSAQLGGEELQKLAFWAKQEALQPDRVKLFFIEDFINEPEMAIKHLSGFLGMPPPDEVQAKVTQRMTLQKAGGLFWKMDGSSGELEHLELGVRQFEEFLAELPMAVQDIWNEKVSLLPSLPQPRLSWLTLSLQQHNLAALPRWWIAHSARLCKPCSYHPRGACKSGEFCSYCHHESHRIELRRDSKRERMRKRRQRERNRISRTPSPDGLSS
mmetsp:Transcript_5914/g.10568  ORF Transcript_5914/g.10568 Transcript_5914/m.10568 type:complete len:409 (-) Transcript_5914:329-1555(-)